MNLPESIRTEIADRTVSVIAPAVTLSMAFAGLAMLFTGDREAHRVIPGVIAALSMVPAWLLARRGKPRIGAVVMLSAITLAVITGMVFSGGIRAPAYVGAVACITMFTLLFGARGGVIYGLFMIAAGALFIWLDHLGMLREAARPPESLYLMFISMYLILQFCFVLIPVNLMNTALVESRNKEEELGQAVLQRQQSQRELESILNKTPDIIYRVDPQGCFTFISDAVRKYGHSPETFLGKPIMDLVHPEDRPSSVYGLKERRTGERSITGLEVRLCMDFVGGDLSLNQPEPFRPFLVSSEGLYADSPGRGLVFQGSQGIARDVSRTRQYESRIMTLAAVIEQAAEDVVITDPEGVIRYVNASFERLSGYTRQEVVGQKTRLFKSGRQDRAFYDHLWQTVKRGETWNGRIWNRIKDGGLVFQDVTITPILDPWGGITAFASIRRDITEQQQKEERRQQSRKMEAMGTLAGGIAHDFNNILGGILGYSELALADLDPDAPAALYARQILKAAERARDLVGQILLFSRQAQQEKQPVQVITLAKEVIHLLRATLPADIRIRTDFRETSGLVLSDPARIHQIFMNLCTNAVQAMRPGGGTLTVTIEEGSSEEMAGGRSVDLPRGRYLKITVSDTGHGIPPDIREKIFDPFFTTKSRGEGTGMGLSVVYGIVEEHGGAVQLDSRVGDQADQGTDFTVFLPAVSPERQETFVCEAAVPKGTERLMFVDDEPDLVTLGKALLERLGYTVTCFSDGRAAWQHFHRDPDRFDLVITDKSMPGMSGMELAEKILTLRPDLPVIMCTGFAESLAVNQAASLGIRKLLGKPVTSRTLGEAVREVLDSGPGPAA